MSALTGALVIGLALVAEDVLIGTTGGPGAVAGIFGGVAKVVNQIADPNVPAIPNRADKKG